MNKRGEGKRDVEVTKRGMRDERGVRRGRERD